MPAINLNTVLLDRRGEPVIFNSGGKPVPLTLREAIFYVLDTPVEGNDQMDIRSKLKLDRIARKCEDGGNPLDNSEAELTSEEVTLILERSSFNPLVTGRMVELLDPSRLNNI